MHDGQFWIGILEAENSGQLKAARILFGSEPKDTEVLEFINRKMLWILDTVKTSIPADRSIERRINPKRKIRKAQKEMMSRSVNTKAQLAMQEELESKKKARQVRSKAQREAEAEYKREIAKTKAKEKHRGH
ncbi:YjdF family protein [Sulfobacillus thermosulfidooxidans]|uniref:YjdF family protein n=1 Tax=Sulfobacillus thermosulfidooxidans TaxID=28034 RepID=UPI0018D2A4E2|nr:YjdF family protein [Sulfobacillus thermosulfidooxidans]